MASFLQPVDCAVDRTLRCALPRLIVGHVLYYDNRVPEQPAHKCWPFNVSEVITAYVAVKLFSETRDLAPTEWSSKLFPELES